MRILITAGGTAEPIDAVRVLTNTSTGRTGVALAEALAVAGHNITLLLATNAVATTHPHITRFTTFRDLEEALREALQSADYDMVIHAAAVSDYSLTALRMDGVEYAPDRNVKRPTAEKMELVLTRNPKLINAIKHWSRNPHLVLAGFKFTSGASAVEAQAAAEMVMRASGADYVLHNDASAMGANRHPFTLFSAGGEAISGETKEDMINAFLAITELPHAACP